MKDQLFMLKPGFFDNDHNGPFYCGDSVAVEGLLGFFPSLRTAVDVHYIDFARPRKPVVDMIGEAHQSIPVLVLASDDNRQDGAFGIKTAEGRGFIDDPDAIRRYLSIRYDIAVAK